MYGRFTPIWLPESLSAWHLPEAGCLHPEKSAWGPRLRVCVVGGIEFRWLQNVSPPKNKHCNWKQKNGRPQIFVPIHPLDLNMLVLQPLGRKIRVNHQLTVWLEARWVWAQPWHRGPRRWRIDQKHDHLDPKLGGFWKGNGTSKNSGENLGRWNIAVCQSKQDKKTLGKKKKT